MDWEREARVVDFCELTALVRAAKRERVDFREQNTIWFGLYYDGELVGCGGLAWVNSTRTKARLKTAYISPEWRGTHGYRALVDARVEYARAEGAETVETTTRQEQIFQHFGWKQIDGRPSNHVYLSLQASPLLPVETLE